MKNYLLLATLGLSLAACQKDEKEDEAYVVPAPVTVAFNQDFSLTYQQLAQIPTAPNPELQVALAEVQYTYCPAGACSDNSSLVCAVGTNVFPRLRVTDAAGQSQQIALPANRPAAGTPNWIDTTSVRANGRRYVLYYVKWKMLKCNPARHDFSVTLRVTKPNGN
ncbi:hypothetical protein GCM10022408_20310 [Hymenobacter fastidiosus]|uniref:Lipoprotein n=1 Tax=Hymenobacter fastidiosus TaxID=486264 RepID=A0ABP7S836_9BACT